MAKGKGGKAAPNMAKGSKTGMVNGKKTGTPGASFHLPKYGNAKGSKMKQGSC